MTNSELVAKSIIADDELGFSREKQQLPSQHSALSHRGVQVESSVEDISGSDIPLFTTVIRIAQELVDEMKDINNDKEAEKEDVVLEDTSKEENRESKADLPGVASAEPESPSKGQKCDATSSAMEIEALAVDLERSTEPVAGSSRSERKKQKQLQSVENCPEEREQPAPAAPVRKGPSKIKKFFSWAGDVEIILSNILREDKASGSTIPASRVHPYWMTVVERLARERIFVSEVQVTEKVRRMKRKYSTIWRIGPDLWRSDHELRLFNIWDKIWGTGAHVGRLTQAKEVSDKSTEKLCGDEEQATGRPSTSTRKPSESSESAREFPVVQRQELAVGKSALTDEAREAKGKSKRPTEGRPAIASEPRLFPPLIPRIGNASDRGVEAAHIEPGGIDSARRKKPKAPVPTIALQLSRTLRDVSTVVQEFRDSCLEHIEATRKETAAIVDDARCYALGRKHRCTPSCSSCWCSDSQGLFRGLKRDDLLHRCPCSRASDEMREQLFVLRSQEIEMEEKQLEIELKRVQLAKEIAKRLGHFD